MFGIVSTCLANVNCTQGAYSKVVSYSTTAPSSTCLDTTLLQSTQSLHSGCTLAYFGVGSVFMASQPTLNLILTEYMYATFGNYQLSVMALNGLTGLVYTSANVPIVVSSAACSPPSVSIPDAHTNPAQPQAVFMKDRLVLTAVVSSINCTLTLNNTKLWQVYSASSAGINAHSTISQVTTNSE